MRKINAETQNFLRIEKVNVLCFDTREIRTLALAYLFLQFFFHFFTYFKKWTTPIASLFSIYLTLMAVHKFLLVNLFPKQNNCTSHCYKQNYIAYFFLGIFCNSYPQLCAFAEKPKIKSTRVCTLLKLAPNFNNFEFIKSL